MKGTVQPEFWKGKKVYLTGHTGFKGSWLALWLEAMGAEVKGFALIPATTPSLFNEANVSSGLDSEIGDIRDQHQVAASMTEFAPEILIHMAAQPLVRLSYSEPVATYATNVMGSIHVLEAARLCPSLRAIVNVTTDKCYENREWEWGYRENEPMGGHDPYSNSKGCVELLTSAYRKSYFSGVSAPALASARAGNVIGGGDWAPDRLIPDILNAFEKQQPIVIRNPLATRPWQHVLEPLSGYLILAQHLWVSGQEFAEGWNFGPLDEDVKPVSWILERMVKLWGGSAKWELNADAQLHEARYLKLDISKARARLNWTPTWGLSTTLTKITQWQHARLQGKDLRQLCLNEIHQYMADMQTKNSLA